MLPVLSPRAWLVHEARADGEAIAGLVRDRTRQEIVLRVTALYLDVAAIDEARPAVVGSFRDRKPAGGERDFAVLARLICDRLLDEELIDLEIAENDFVFQLESLILKDLRIEDEIDEDATEWIKKNRRHVEEGSTEWEVEMERVKEELAVARGYVIR